MAKIKEDEIKQLEERITSLEDQLKRAVADYHNLEKRVQADSSAIASYLRGELVIKLLPVLDSLDQAVAGVSGSEAESGWVKGVLMSIKQFRQALADDGLVEIPAQDNFDPNLHEALDVHEGEDNKILEVLQRGYTLNGKVLRPAKVVVGKKVVDTEKNWAQSDQTKNDDMLKEDK